MLRKLDESGRRRLQFILARVLSSMRSSSFAQSVAVDHAHPAHHRCDRRALAYLALLREQPAALERLIDACVISGFLAQQIAEFPLLLDELIDRLCLPGIAFAGHFRARARGANREAAG